jgi:X-X-X-Leu-X-X-Gly heptad repeat protein
MASAKNETVNAVFYDNYMLQISMTLDSDKCSDVESPGATIASAGKNMVIAHTVMPGKDADITLAATVSDFEMDGIGITAMPFSMEVDLPDTDGMVDDFTKLSDAISDLNDGVGDLADGVAELRTGANKLKNGSADIKDGLSQLSDNSGQFIAASAQVKDALAQIIFSLGDGLSGDFDPEDLAQLPEGLTQLSQGLQGISGGLADLKNAFVPAYAALDAAMQAIPDTSIMQAQLTDLYAQTDPSQHALLDELVDSYAAGQTAKGTYSSVKGAFDAVGPTIDTLTGSIDSIARTLDDVSENIGAALSGLDGLDQWGQLVAGLTALSQNYGDFHSGLAEYMGGVTGLADGYTDFHLGLSAFNSGVRDLYDGVEELHDGTGELRDETADMPETMQTEIDDMLDEYTGVDFDPVSFTSPLNGHIGLVQFVLKCDGISMPDKTSEVVAEPEQETIWDRLIALFAGKGE